MTKKLNIAIIFGGKSGEHEVSLVSATAIIENLNRKKYNIFPIGITKTGLPRRSSDEIGTKAGEWLTGPNILNKFKNGLKDKKGLKRIVLDPAGKFIAEKSTKKIDVAFPVLHGTYGEDGTIQGLFEMMNIPYVGADVLGSAIGMDKVVQKKLLHQEGLPIVDFFEFRISVPTGHLPKGDNYQFTTKIQNSKFKIKNLNNIVRRLKFPVFIKPANMGSSVGISKAHNEKELKIGLNLAKKYDNKIIIEATVPNNREFECSVLGNENPKTSVVGEVIASNEFYDYNAKYIDEKSKTIVPAKISKKLSKQIQDLSIRTYKTLNCAGMARVDFLYDSKKRKLFINEINTIPGFTKISMYPKLWMHSGLKYNELLDKLINLAIKKHKNKNKLLISYKPSKNWHK